MRPGSIVVVALPFERKALLRSGAAVVRDDIAEFRSWCTGISHRVVQSGLGLVAAARAVDTVLAVVRPTAILSVGCAGGLDPSLTAGDIVMAVRVADGPVPATGSDGLAGELARDLRRSGIHVQRGSIASVANVVASESDKQRLFLRTGSMAVDMESASIAKAASAAGVPFCGIRVVLDDARTAVPPSIHDERFRQLPFALVAKRLEAIGAALLARE